MQIASIEQVIDKLLIFMFKQINVWNVNRNVQILTQIKFQRPKVVCEGFLTASLYTSMAKSFATQKIT